MKIELKDINSACDKQVANVIKKILIISTVVYILEFFLIDILNNLLTPALMLDGLGSTIIWFGIITATFILCINTMY